MNDKKKTSPRDKVVRMFKRLGYDLTVGNPNYPTFAPLALIAGSIDKEEQERIIARLKRSLRTYHEWQQVELMALLYEDDHDFQALINRMVELSWEKRATTANTTELLMLVVRSNRVEPELRKQALQKMAPYGIREYNWWKEQSTYCKGPSCPRETIDIVLERLVDLVPTATEGQKVLSAINENTNDPKDSSRIALRERLKDRMIELTTTFEEAEQQWQLARSIRDEKRTRLLLEKAYQTADKLHHWKLIPEMVSVSWQLFPSFKENPPDVPELREAILSMLPYGRNANERLSAFWLTAHLRKEYAYNRPTTEDEREKTLDAVRADIVERMLNYSGHYRDYHFWKAVYDEAESKRSSGRDWSESGKSLFKGIDLLQDAAAARLREIAKSFEERTTALRCTKDKEQRKEQLLTLAKKAWYIQEWETIYKLATELGVLELQIMAHRRVKARLFDKSFRKNFDLWRQFAEKDLPCYEYILGPAGRATLDRQLRKLAKSYDELRFLLQWSKDESTKKIALKRITALVRLPKKNKNNVKPSKTKES